MFDEPSNLESGIHESVVEVGDRSVENEQRRFVAPVDRDLPGTGVEIAPLDGPRLVIQVLVEGMWNAEDEDTTIPQDAMGFEERPVETFDHLERRFRGRDVEPVVGERQARHVATDELCIDTVEVPQLPCVAQLLAGEIDPDGGLST
jgi:hypothetical protein